ncbi:hypothetical protein ACIBCT_30020 [Streptosporangium sp. NPDC050855]|uniref:hypothetical protein n=1 Tax=Streptosporangium sp. NPDC050855 TaxID=3366194 RepID=UPI0037A1482A
MQRVVVDPEVPREVADLFRRSGPMLSRFRAGRVPRQTGDSRLPGKLVGTLGVSTAALSAALGVLGGSPLLAIFLMIMLGGLSLVILSVVYIARKPSSVDSVERVLYRHCLDWQGRFLILEDFDHDSRHLLGRVQRAIDFIVKSRTNSLGMLDSVRNSVMLPAEEWEIARLLTKLSALRARHRHLARGGRSPEVVAAMAPLERALAASEAAVTARVEALERYARHVADADRALLSQGQIEVLKAHLPEYEQLVAEAGAATFALPEIGYLSDDAAMLRQALRESVRSAHEAFRHLDG